MLTRRRFLSTLACGSALLSGCATPGPTPFTGKLAGFNTSGNADSLKKQLESVLNQVNAKFSYQTDQDIYGIHDYWVTASAQSSWRGDCEDHALLCQQLLREKGITHSMLLTCWTELGDYHCTLYVEGWVLDVRHPWVMSNSELVAMGYKWHKIGTEDGRWYFVDSSTA